MEMTWYPEPKHSKMVLKGLEWINSSFTWHQIYLEKSHMEPVMSEKEVKVPLALTCLGLKTQYFYLGPDLWMHPLHRFDWFVWHCDTKQWFPVWKGRRSNEHHGGNPAKAVRWPMHDCWIVMMFDSESLFSLPTHKYGSLVSGPMLQSMTLAL